MSNLRPESRIKSLEQRATDIEADIVELSADTAEEFKVLRQEIKQGHIDIGKSLDSHADALTQEIRKQATKDDLNKLESRIDAKMSAMETRIIDTFTRLLQQESDG